MKLLLVLTFFLSVEALWAQNITLTSIEKNWPQRFHPEDVDDAFGGEQDLPASLFAISGEEIKQRYQEKSRIQTQNLDLEVIVSMNIEAAHLWSEMVQCQIADSKNQSKAAENARKVYLEKENFCPHNKNSDLKINNQLVRLHQNIRNFLISSRQKRVQQELVRFNYFHKMFYISENSKDLLFLFNKLPDVLPLAHPLFVQMVVEHLSSSYHFFKIDDEDNEEMGNYIMAFFEQRNLSEQEFHSKNSIIERASIIVNAFFLLDILPVGQCRLWSLWPAALRTMLRTTSNVDYCNTEKCFNTSDVAQKILLSCGYPQEAKGLTFYETYESRFASTIIDQFNDAHEDIIEKYRELNNQYRE